MSPFWRNWMIALCFGVGLFGLVLAGGAVEETEEPTRWLFDILNGSGGFELDSDLRFTVAVLGAVMFGWSITLYAAIQAANQLGEEAGRGVWRLITVSVVGWYVVDSTLSIVTGFELNAVLNTLILAAFLVPMAGSGVLRD
jgi:hypothetical protein